MLVVLIGLLLIVCSYFFIAYGTVFVISNWTKFDRSWKTFLVVAPVALMGIGVATQIVWISLSFGALGGIPFLILSAPWEVGPLYYGAGAILNGLGFIGLIRFIEKRREKRALVTRNLI